jgi:hypothetical protein
MFRPLFRPRQVDQLFLTMQLYNATSSIFVSNEISLETKTLAIALYSYTYAISSIFVSNEISLETRTLDIALYSYLLRNN